MTNTFTSSDVADSWMKVIRDSMDRNDINGNLIGSNFGVLACDLELSASNLNRVADILLGPLKGNHD